MRRLPDILNHFINGEYTVRFQPGLANAIAQDNGIESSYMLHGHSKSGQSGNTTRKNATAVWSLSLGVRSKLVSNLKSIATGGGTTHDVTHHRDE